MSFVGSRVRLALATVVSIACALAAPAAAATRAVSPATYVVSLRGFASTTTTAQGPSAQGPSAPAGAASRDGALESARIGRIDRTIGGLEVRYAFRAGFTYHWAIQGFAADLTAAQAAMLRRDPVVAAVARSLPVKPADTQVVPAGVARVHATPPSAGGPALPDLRNVNVAVLDTGIRHLVFEPELTVRGGVDCTRPHGGTTPGAWQDVDPEGHGTHVAGILGARDNLTGVVGVAPGVALWSVRVFGFDDDEGLVGSTATLLCGIDWVASTRGPSSPIGARIDVANMSLVSPNVPVAARGCPDPATPLHDAICTATDTGHRVTFVVAAGNEDADAATDVPAAFDQVIAVAAITDYDGKPGGLGTPTCAGGGADDWFAPYSNHGPAVDLVAPGSCILSLARTATGGSPAGTRLMSGTSMAAPYVAGAAARYVASVLAADPASRPAPAQVRSALRAASGFDWNVATDPAGLPDRLLDVGALSGDASVGIVALPGRVIASRGVAQQTVAVELVRRGLDAVPVDLAVGTLPAGVTASLASTRLTGLSDGGISTSLHLGVGAGAVDGDSTLAVSATAAGGPAVTAKFALHVDRAAPTMTFLAANLVKGSTLGSTVRVRLAWAATDAPPGRIATYAARRVVGAATTAIAVSPPTATITTTTMTPRIDVSFAVRATDNSGNAGAWRTLAQRVGLRESTHPSIHYSTGDWQTVAHASASGGRLATTRHAGASASFTFTGVGVAWVAPEGPAKGRATFILDGHRFSVNLAAASQQPRLLVFASGPLASGPHAVTIVAESGTVDLDAILVLA